MVTVANGVPEAETVGFTDSIARCYFEKTQQEMKYDFDTLQRDWVCVRVEGEWALVFRY